MCVCSSSSVGSPLLKAAAAEQSTERGGLPSGTTTLLLTGACHCRLWQQLHRLYFISAYSFFFPLFMATYYTKVKVRSSTECDDVITLSSLDFLFLVIIFNDNDDNKSKLPGLATISSLISSGCHGLE